MPLTPNAQADVKLKLGHHLSPVFQRFYEAPFSEETNSVHRGGGEVYMKSFQKVLVIRQETAVITLPPKPQKDDTVIIKNRLERSTKETITLTPDGGALIDGKSSIDVPAMAGVFLYFDGEEWLTI